MQQEMKPFFSPIHNDLQISESDYAQTEVCIAMADAMARTTVSTLLTITERTFCMFLPIRCSFVVIRLKR